MAEKNEKKGLGLPQTKGSFQIRGVVTGTEKSNFYKETITKTKKNFRLLNFGVKTSKENTAYVNLSGMEKDKVYFSKTKTENGKKTSEVKEIPWKDRYTFNAEGFKMMGVNIGVTKKTNEKGESVNDKKVITDYDACLEVSNNLKDDQDVFIKGSIDFSHYESNGNMMRSVKFNPNQISLCGAVNFEDEKFKEVANFEQTIVFMGIEQQDNRFAIQAKIIGYNSIEDAEFYTLYKALANVMRKELKPYNSITVWGNIATFIDKSTESTDNSISVWGKTNEMEKINTPIKRELIITGADPSTLDKDTYSEEIIEQALATLNSNKKAENDYGLSKDWGSSNSASSDDDTAW